jgi:thiosulfate dehydrogenase (quinone) large subunit
MLPEITQVYTIPGYAILPLRLFLGFTFIYAGIQKISDPGFFAIGSSTYIGTQLLNFSRHSPIQFLMKQFLEHAVAIGVLTIMTEIAIGILVTLGLFTRLASIGGLILNMGLFLTASWNVYPYFLGSDIVFVIGWLTLAIAGPGGYTLDPLARKIVADVFSPRLQRLMQGPFLPFRTDQLDAAEPAPIRPEITPAAARLSRREALIAGLATVVLVILGLGPRAKFGAGSSVASGAAPGNAATPPAAQPTTPAGQPTPPPASSAGGTKVGTTSQIPVNSGLATTDPKTGDPAVVVHTSGSSFVAYDAVCTHAGCTVQYDPQYKLLVCPCHGGGFDPSNGQVVAGPPPAPLTSLPITIDSQGNIFLT